MNGDDKKYIFGLLKRYGIVIGSSLLISLGVNSCRKYKNKKEIGEIVDDSEFNSGSLENLTNYSIKFKN